MFGIKWRYLILWTATCGVFFLAPVRELYEELHWSLFQLSRTSEIDSLEKPIPVLGWSAEGLNLEDGRTVQLPGFLSLPEESVALAEATKRGVEIRDDGRILGLVRVWHTCGNDPVREQIAKVDIAAMLLFLEIGNPEKQFPRNNHLEESEERFFERGWYHLDFKRFQSWQTKRFPLVSTDGLLKD